MIAIDSQNPKPLCDIDDACGPGMFLAGEVKVKGQRQGGHDREEQKRGRS